MVYELASNVVGQTVARHHIGAYVLGFFQSGAFVGKYVGRSDRCLQARLLRHAADGRYSHFRLHPTQTIFAAFQTECREWHAIPGLENKIHPDAPKRLPYTCPYCGAGRDVAKART